ncbi:MAG: hypothetical protein F4Y28_02785 [Acidimicrobiia bacterium]|nr:hypothetical protein [Acidimicrobiia bacterium]MYJ31847.1 hypothetical protein [Acidimicrobiia bacterium]
MSDPPTRRAPPGWYAEQGQRGYRFWDGESWSDPPGVPVGILGGGNGRRNSPGQLRAGLAFMGAAMALLIAGLLLPWSDAESQTRGVLDGDIPWLLGLGSVADTWLLVLLAAAMLWTLLVGVLAGNTPMMWLTALVVGLAVMGFCLAEGLAMDGDLDLAGAQVGSGLFVAYAGGAAGAVGGVLLRPSR